MSKKLWHVKFKKGSNIFRPSGRSTDLMKPNVLVEKFLKGMKSFLYIYLKKNIMHSSASWLRKCTRSFFYYIQIPWCTHHPGKSYQASTVYWKKDSMWRGEDHMLSSRQDAWVWIPPLTLTNLLKRSANNSCILRLLCGLNNNIYEVLRIWQIMNIM